MGYSADGIACCNSYQSCKALFRVGLLMCFLLLLLGIIVEEHDNHAAPRSVLMETYDHQEEDTDRDHTEYHAAAPAAAGKIVDINYMSKRRVPNGPDPIHNRRAGKSRLPPIRA